MMGYVHDPSRGQKSEPYEDHYINTVSGTSLALKGKNILTWGKQIRDEARPFKLYQKQYDQECLRCRDLRTLGDKDSQGGNIR